MIERVRLGRDQVGAAAENLLALWGLSDPSPEAWAGAVHLADAIHALTKGDQSKKR